MSELSWTTYDYVGHVLTEEEFQELQKAYFKEPEAFSAAFQVNPWKEALKKFSFQLSALALSAIIVVLSVAFFPNPESGWLKGIVTAASFICLLAPISIGISFGSFLKSVNAKRDHLKLTLYLLHTCPDHKTYLDKYYQYTLGTSQ